jgi:hypothetical protein
MSIGIGNTGIGFDDSRKTEKYAARRILACNPGDPMYVFWSRVFVDRVAEGERGVRTADISSVVGSQLHRKSLIRRTYVRHGRKILEFAVMRSLYQGVSDKLLGCRELPQ